MKALSLNPSRERVVIDGQEHYIVELTAQERDEYLNRVSERMRGDGPARYDGLQAELVSRALRGPGDARFTFEAVQGWPAGTVAALFELAQRVNGLTAPADQQLEDRRKN